MEQHFLMLQDVTVKSGASIALEHINLQIRRGEQWAIIGDSGSGKTVLAQTIAGRHFFSGHIEYYFDRGEKNNRISLVEQQHRFKNLMNTGDMYYQQRFNASDAGSTMTAEQELRDNGFTGTAIEWERLDDLHIRQLLSKPLIQLSNGENKRLQLAIALLPDPELLILDNPFPGLDSEGRKTVHGIINMLILSGRQFLVITSPMEIPEGITHIAKLEKGKFIFAGKKDRYGFHEEQKVPATWDPIMLKKLARDNDNDFAFAVRMSGVHVRYGSLVILENINWDVKKGERWCVSGPNGSGKSTLLSLINGDNPQAYANEIYLFDRRRGTGESIWDIKRKIGFVSPELHLYFDYAATCFEVIASGIFDTIGLFRKLPEDAAEKVRLWLRLLGLEPLQHKRLSQLSAGQQRVVLLARALIKNPPLLILDEPCQGLDDVQTFYIKDLVNRICEEFGTTLIYVSHYKDQIPECVTRFLELNTIPFFPQIAQI